MGQRSCHSIQSERARRPSHCFHRRPTGDRVGVHHLPRRLIPTPARCTRRVLWRSMCRRNPDRSRNDEPVSEPMAEPGGRSSPGQRRVSVLVRQILGATTRWSPSGGCDGSARVGKAQAAAAGRRIGPGPKELPHPKDGKNPQNSRKNPPSPSEDWCRDPSVLSPDLIPTMVKKSKKIKNRLTCFASLGTPITRHPSIQRFPQLSRPPRNHRHAQRCQQRPHDRHHHPGDGSAPSSAGLAGRAGRSGHAAVWKVQKISTIQPLI